MSFKVGAELDKLGDFTSKFFDGNAPEWIKIFEREQSAKRTREILEIGSWEGRSATFLLTSFPEAHITCVDTWQGSEEHAGDATAQTIEQRFDANMKQFGARVQKFKGTSLEFFASAPLNPRFDLVYVDGSHHADDVMVDVLNGFRCLHPGGIMLCDDYLWDWYPNVRHNPAIAIHYLLRQKAGEYDILNVTGTQIAIKKHGA